MNDSTIYRLMEPGEEKDICALVERVFIRFIAPYYSEEGVNEFLTYVQPHLLAARYLTNHFVVVSYHSNKLIGMIEARDSGHISLLFVDEAFQRKGIGKELVRRSLEICRRDRPELRTVTVHSSPNAVSAYERFGFEPEGPERIENGIRFVPMVLDVGEWMGPKGCLGRTPEPG